jgi:hypothetical protein
MFASLITVSNQNQKQLTFHPLLTKIHIAINILSQPLSLHRQRDAQRRRGRGGAEAAATTVAAASLPPVSPFPPTPAAAPPRNPAASRKVDHLNERARRPAASPRSGAGISPARRAPRTARKGSQILASAVPGSVRQLCR